MEEIYKGYTIKIEQDPDPLSPRDGQDTKMICFHRRYNLGDQHNFKNLEQVMKYIIKTKAISLPLYLYDHSGLSMSTKKFSCNFDSGLVGVIYMERKQVLNEFYIERVTKVVTDKVYNILKDQVNNYDSYLRGEVYGYIIEKNGEEIDSCWGFLGHKEYCLEEARNRVEELIPQSIKFIKEGLSK